MKIKIAFLALVSFSLGVNAQSFKTPDTNTDFNHLTRVGGGAALYINQVSSDSSFPILRLSSGIYEPNKNVRFTFENNGNLGIGTIAPSSKLQLMNGNDGLSLDASESWIGLGFNRSVKTGQIFNVSKSAWQITARDERISFEGYNGAFSNLLNILKNGDIGIGTTTPKAKLDIIGNVKLGNGAAYTDLLFQTGTSITGYNGVFEITPKTLPGSGTAKQVTYFKNASHSNGKTTHNVIVDGNVGIGITNPKAKLDVEGGIVSKAIKTKNSNTDFNHFTRVGGGAAVYINQVSTDETKPILRLSSGIYEPNKNVRFTVENNGNVGIGTTTPGEWKLAVNGKIKTKEIKVSLDGWSDFVFYDDYKLPTLDEVENHIAENGHLKDIPSAKEVEKNGIFLGEMDSKLLQKIEELTLYTIQQQKEIKALKKQNAKIEKQEKEIAELKVLVQKLLNK